MKTQLHATVSCQLITFPVGVATATSTKKLVTFNRVHRKCLQPVKTSTWCATCKTFGSHLPPEEIGRGWEFAKGQRILVEDSETDAIGNAKSRDVEIDKFVHRESVWMMPIEHDYYLIPEGLEVQLRAYRTLHEAMVASEVEGFGVCNLFGTERPFLLAPAGPGGLMLRLLKAADEIVEPDFDTPHLSVVRDSELELTHRLVASMSGEFRQLDLIVEAQRELRRYVETKAAGGTVVLPPEAEEKEYTTDLEAMLRASLELTNERVEA